ncbi:MAG: rRNA-processing UTP23 [Lasallia pustulata]|uniref:U three protein 23 n=1 Tax=Lasallia pustulata TaxID=136370 RepID=A0A5M8Q2V4_9LECA|nr:MAG: rRNA-processing UTP23 [Lasallia pustulata]
MWRCCIPVAIITFSRIAKKYPNLLIQLSDCPPRQHFEADETTDQHIAMRGKRSKQYRKLMQQYGLTFGFREPYQVLVDAQMIQDTNRFSMDLVAGLERTLHGKVKPMITQCSIRHLYTLSEVPPRQKEALITVAKTFERRRCNHHTLEVPFSTLECLRSVVDPKDSQRNKNRYVIASQEDDVRRKLREIPGVPLVYVKRSVMVMEPMAEGSVGIREGVERGKFRAGLKGRNLSGVKRKREPEDEADTGKVVGTGDVPPPGGDEDLERMVKKRKARGPKGPNPLSVKKPKKEKSQKEAEDHKESGLTKAHKEEVGSGSLPIVDSNIIEASADGTETAPAKRKRKRKHKPGLVSELAETVHGGDGVSN